MASFQPWAGAGVIAVALMGAYACSSTSDEHTFAPPLSQASSGNGGASTSSGVGGSFVTSTTSAPPAADAGGLCGNDIHKIKANTPNVYFILDASGSMSEPSDESDPSSPSRYAKLREATINVVRELGSLINVGAAIFPIDPNNDDGCAVGEEVMSTRLGDPNVGKDGPTTKKLEQVTKISPLGGTPTAATLRALLPKLKNLNGQTIVVLATDGGPNCNLQAVCTAANCQANIEDIPGCDAQHNCCAGSDQNFGPYDCNDEAPTVAAVKAIADAGIQVYVVGIPGSEVYSDTLGQMALAGGAATFASPYYYEVGNIATLQATLGSIASVAVSCSFTLTDPPKDRNETNVYLNGQVLPADPLNGWAFNDEVSDNSVIDLIGKACNELKTGQVQTVQIVSGCPTDQPK